MPHYDALVFTLCISGFDVHKVLIDLSNTVDSLQLPAFNQMKLFSGILNFVGRITTTTLGDITLSIQARPVTQQVLFSVVEDLGPYNVIVSQTWLHLMKVVPSTYHQTVSYVTNAGKVDLLSSQLVERQGYQLYNENKKGKRAQIVLPLKITPPHSNHRWPPRSGQKRRIH